MKPQPSGFIGQCHSAVESSPLLRQLALPVARALRDLALRVKYASIRGYNAPKYWADRHSRYGFDMRGVGYEGLSHEENQRMYQKAGEVFLALCRHEGLDFQSVRMLDIGCGTGFYAELFQKNGGRHYLGVDVTDVLFPELRRRFPDFSFRLLDISSEKLEGVYDLVAMIDVTQHIVSERHFAFAMANVRDHLSDNGAFIVTSWLTAERKRRQFYEIARPLADYKTHFPGYKFGQPVPFRDKSIFAIRRQTQPPAAHRRSRERVAAGPASPRDCPSLPEGRKGRHA